MAIEKSIKSRIVLTHDEYEALKGKTLKHGEVVLAKVGSTNGDSGEEPIWMMKVGKEGDSTTVENCPWLVAPAADVYTWAKKENLDANDLPAIPGDKLGILLNITYEGNAITDAHWDSTGKTLTLTKGATFTTKGEFDGHKHYISGTGDDAIDVTGGELSIAVKHVKTFDAEVTTEPYIHGEVNDSKISLTLPAVKVNKYGHVDAINPKVVELNLPEQEKVVLPTVTDTAVEGKLVTAVSQTDGAIAVTRDTIEVAHTDGTIYLTIGGKKIGSGFSDADFIKDGFLESVTKDVEANTIIFKWNTDAGITETVIDIDDLVEVYTAGDGITVEDYVISHAIPTSVSSDVTATAGKFIAGIKFDKFGHVAEVTTMDDADTTYVAGNYIEITGDNNSINHKKPVADFSSDNWMAHQVKLKLGTSKETSTTAMPKSFLYDNYGHVTAQFDDTWMMPSIVPGAGLKLTEDKNVTTHYAYDLEIDEATTFIIDCGGAE